MQLLDWMQTLFSPRLIPLWVDLYSCITLISIPVEIKFRETPAENLNAAGLKDFEIFEVQIESVFEYSLLVGSII